MRRTLERHWRFNSVDLPDVEPDEVWKAVVPVDLAHLLDPTVVDARQEGDVQVFVHELDGRCATRRVRVTEVDPPFVAECVDLDGDLPGGTRYEIEPLAGGGSRLTLQAWRGLSAAGADVATMADLEEYLQRVRFLLAPSPDGTTPPCLPVEATGRAAAPTRSDGGLAPGWFGPAEQASRSVLLRGVTPQQVWDVIRPAEAGTYDPEVIRAYVERGTGPGVGEVQVFVHHDGREVRNRVVAEQAPFLVRTQNLGSGPDLVITYELEQRRRGTRFTMTASVRPPAGSVVVDLGRQHRRHTEAFFGWVRAELRRRSGD